MSNDIKDVFCKIQYMMSKEFFNGLNSCEIEYAVIKGCPLAYYKTGNVGSRLSSDIDILISRCDIDKVVELLEVNGFQNPYVLNRKERIMLVSNSHQIPAYSKYLGKCCVQIDVNFDLFWGEYKGKRIDVLDFLEGTVEMDIYGCRIRTLPPLECMVQLILHHYKEMNSLYHLTGHIAITRRMFEDIYILCKRYPTEISIDRMYEAGRRYGILPYAYYMFYYTRQVYDDALIDGYLEALYTEESKRLLNCYGLSDQERKIWKIDFSERLDADVSKMIESELSKEDREKLERNRRLFG
ncbi:MAG: nucleotidyltransferase family protein [Lachnospiraceae bacterium]|nr:nucleotidyltransferase family protein [uncultured Acetatifactor sp.]MCI8790819.1 nucleotidyltransferase family protein [Lachnospiraceae bacterium]